MTRALLAEKGFTEAEGGIRYTGEAFGSWVITLAHQPRLRIVWDGKDGWAVIQAELIRDRRTYGDPWQDLWIGKQDEDQAPDAVVRALEQLRDYATEVRKA